jgi:hypothetical protein
MKNIFSGDNTLLLGGLAVAAVAAFYLTSKKAIDGGTSGGGNAGSLWGGPTPQATGQDPPVIYQFPPEGQVNFPQQDKSGWEDLLKGLFQPLLPDITDPVTTGTKKESNIINTALSNFITGGADWTNKQVKAGDIGPVYAESMRTYQTGGADRTFAAGTYPGVVAGNGISDGYTKKEADIRPYGFSDQYIKDPITGYDQWNNYAGFGLSKDPVTGETVAFQRDVYLVNLKGETLWNPVTKKGNALIAVAQDNKDGVFSISTDFNSLTTAEKAQVIAQATPGYVANSYDYSAGYNALGLTAPTKKEAASVATSGLNSSGGVGSSAYGPAPQMSISATVERASSATEGSKKAVASAAAAVVAAQAAAAAYYASSGGGSGGDSSGRTDGSGRHTASYMSAYNGG